MPDDQLTQAPQPTEAQLQADRAIHLEDALAESTPIAWVTPALVAINVLVFLAMLLRGVPFLQPNAFQVLPWGANFGPLTTTGQWWRLLTACFLHFGILHIAVNMYILFQVGIFTERLFGNLRYLVLYLLAGIGGNIAGLYLHPFSVGAGASGAIFGVYGALLGFLLIERGVVPARAARSIAFSAGIFVIYEIASGFARPDTDQVAHVGGLVTGFLAGCALARPLAHRRAHIGIRRAAVVTVAGVALALLAIHKLPAENPAQRAWYTEIYTKPAVILNGKDRVVYSGSATPEEARQVGQTLTQIHIFQSQGAVVELHRDASGGVLSIPLAPDTAHAPAEPIPAKPADGKPITKPAGPLEPWRDPNVLLTYRAAAPIFAAIAGGPPFTLQLLDSKGQPQAQIKTLSGEVLVTPHDRVIYSGGANAAEANALGAALKKGGFLVDRGAIVLLTRATSSTPPEVSILVNDSALHDTKAIHVLGDILRNAAPSIGGLPVTLHLLDPKGEPRERITVTATAETATAETQTRPAP